MIIILKLNYKVWGDNMKGLMNCLYIDLKKTIISYGFIVSIMITFLLCFSSVIYTNSFTGKEHTAIEIILTRKQFNMIQFFGREILLTSVSPYITIFLPVLSAIPFVTVFCAERLSGNMRFTITRTNSTLYIISKFISALVSGALSIMLGFVLYSIVICSVFGYNGTISEIVKMYIGMALYGMVSVLPAFFLSAFIKNKYMICCFPFILMHFYYTIISKIQDYFNSKDMGLTVVKMRFLYPDTIKNILLGDTASSLNIVRNEIIYFSALIILSFLGFAIIMNRRFDHGQ